MLNAQYAKVLSKKMSIIGGIRKKIFRGIFDAIAYGESKYVFEAEQTEILNWVLEDLVDIGYKVSRIPRYFRYHDVNEIKDYVYTIEW